MKVNRVGGRWAVQRVGLNMYNPLATRLKGFEGLRVMSTGEMLVV